MGPRSRAERDRSIQNGKGPGACGVGDVSLPVHGTDTNLADSTIVAALPRLILDCDPGHDDAFAILVAAAFGELIGVTTTHGNVGVELTTNNALTVIEMAGLEVPVHKGMSRPLLAPLRNATRVHGETGLAGARLPAVATEAASTDAVGFIIGTVRETEDVWLVATGPLTNVAAALRAAPDLSERLAGISFMGGSAGCGNVTAVAEFNLAADPEAAAMVIASGVPVIKMVGLNLTYQVLVGAETITRLRAVGGGLSEVTADLIAHYAGVYDELYGWRGAPMHDPCAVAGVLIPELIGYERRWVEVELRGEHTRGMTVVDERPRLDLTQSNLEVGYTVDAERMRDALVEAVARFS